MRSIIVGADEWVPSRAAVPVTRTNTFGSADLVEGDISERRGGVGKKVSLYVTIAPTRDK